MASPTMTLIQSVTVPSGGSASIDFTSIPSTYTDLVLKSSTRGDNAAAYNNSFIRFNNDSASNYLAIALWGNSTGAVSVSAGASTEIQYIFSDAANATSNTFANSEIYIPNYAGSTQKSVSFDNVSENNLGTTNAAIANLMAGKWSGTAAINRITIYPQSTTNFVQYSTAYLYGVKNS